MTKAARDPSKHQGHPPKVARTPMQNHKQSSVHLVIGPVGAGKTHFARQRSSQSSAMFFDLDTWMVRLFGDDLRPKEGVMAWYLERRERCRALIWDLCQRLVDRGSDVYLELGLLGVDERIQTYERIDAAGYRLKIYVLDSPRNIRRERVLRRNEMNQPGTQIVPIAFFERSSDAWEPPTEDERARWEILDFNSSDQGSSSHDSAMSNSNDVR